MEPSNASEGNRQGRPRALELHALKRPDPYPSLALTPSTSSSASSLLLWSRPESTSSSSPSSPGSATPATEVFANGKEEQNEFARNVLQVLARKTPHILLENPLIQKQFDLSSVTNHNTEAIRKASEPTIRLERRSWQAQIERDISSVPISDIAEVDNNNVHGASQESPQARQTANVPSTQASLKAGIVLHLPDLEEGDISTISLRNIATADVLAEYPESNEGASQSAEDSASSISRATTGGTGTSDILQKPGELSPNVLPPSLSLPAPLPIPTFGGKQDEALAHDKPVIATPVPDEAGTPVASREKGIFRSVSRWLQHRYYLTEEPTLILPSPPDEEEKTHYLITHRVTLCAVGVFAFLTSSAGIWLFTLCGNIFYWFGLFAGFLQLYLALFHLTGLISKNFDYKQHQKIGQDYAVTDETAPTVDIFLPCCKEPLEILENTYKYVQKMEYPQGRLKVHVLDDGAMKEVEALAARYGFNYICRDDRPRLKKAGNLRWAFARTDGEYFVIYDADFCPRHDYLTELIPRMRADPNIAIIQTPQYFRTLDTQTWVERGAGAVQELFYRYIQVNRNKWGGAICVGSNAMYRREALAGTGGTAEVGASEDVHTGFYAVNNGWTLSYIPLCLACGICPDNPRAFFSQQVRWCEGSTGLLINWEFWRSNLTKTQKMCYLSGMLYYSASALTIFVNPLPGILLMWFRIEFLLYYNLIFAIPSLLYGWFIYKIWSRSHHALCVQFIGVIQQYAYLSALKDRIVGTSFAWVPSGDNKAHQSPRYRNMRWFCIAWTFTYNAFFISGCAYRMLEGHAWYNFLPLILLNAFLLYKTLPFILAR